MTLMIEAGANAISRTELAALPVPPPQGPRHFQRPFVDDVETVLDNFAGIGGVLSHESYAVAHDPITQLPRRYFGLMEIALPGHADDTYALQIGLRGSYDQSVSRALGVGSRVFVCSNLCFSAEVAFHTKQTLNVNQRIGPMIATAVQRVPVLAEAQSAQFERYRNTVITRRQGDAFLVECIRRGALTPSQLGTAVREWDTPSYDEHGELGWTAWRLMNAATQSLKNPNAQGQLAATWHRSRVLTQYLDEVVDHPHRRMAA